MILELVSVIDSIKKLAPKLVQPVLDQATRNEAIQRILKELKFNPTQPPDNVDGVYVYTLIEYGVDKPDPILNLFREKEIKDAFWQAYTSNSPLSFIKKVNNFIESYKLGDEIRDLGIEIDSELEKFGQVFIDVAKRTKSKQFDPYPNWDMAYYPGVIRSLIKDKTKNFYGRKFVFDAINRFLNKNSKGYFIVLGDPGMGKSAIAAKYTNDHKSPCFFNLRAQGSNSPEQFLDSIRQQLIKRYQLQNAEKDDLSSLLDKTSRKLSDKETLVIVVDALDEVEQDGKENILYLPTTLPEQVYFLLTRRPYTGENKRFNVSPDVPVEECDLRHYNAESRKDVEGYINLFITAAPDHNKALQQWIKDRNITDEEFVKQVASKSQDNFMYLRYVLPAIAEGKYNDLTLTQQLPDGLQAYYQTHWSQMGMDNKPQENKAIVLFILVEIGTAIPCQMIADIAQQDVYEVQSILDEWVEFLMNKRIDGDICYTIYHASFTDFVKTQKSMDSKRKLFKEVNQRIVDYWDRIANVGTNKPEYC